MLAFTLYDTPTTRTAWVSFWTLLSQKPSEAQRELQSHAMNYKVKTQSGTKLTDANYSKSERKQQLIMGLIG